MSPDAENVTCNELASEQVAVIKSFFTDYIVSGIVKAEF